MVKVLSALVLAIVFTVPALAQEDFPQFEIAMGYGNFGPGDLTNERHSGFAMHTGFNFTHWLGLDNYTGYYSLGNNATMFANIFGAKVAARNLGRIVPYGVAGLGGNTISIPQLGEDGGFATRIGGGLDIQISDALIFKVDVSRMSISFVGERFSGTNFSTGIGFSFGQ